MCIDLHVRIDLRYSLLRRLQLRPADVGGRVNDLSLQVSEVNYVEIDNPHPPNTGGRKIKREGRTQASSSDTQDFRRLDLFLTFQSDFRHYQMPAVPQYLVSIEIDRFV